MFEHTLSVSSGYLVISLANNDNFVWRSDLRRYILYTLYIDTFAPTLPLRKYYVGTVDILYSRAVNFNTWVSLWLTKKKYLRLNLPPKKSAIKIIIYIPLCYFLFLKVCVQLGVLKKQSTEGISVFFTKFSLHDT